MADFLVYFHSFWKDANARHSQVLDWHSKAQHLYDRVEPGDSLWLVVASTTHGEWCLRSRYIIQEKRLLSHPTPWGQFEFKGDGKGTGTFEVDFQNDFTAVLKSLQFKTGRRIRLTGAGIGMALQRPRELCESDTVLLAKFSQGLKPI